MTDVGSLLKVRDRTAEKQAALNKKAMRLGQLMDDRNTGKLGEEVIRIAQAMLLCTLPYSATVERSIERKARLGDGSTLYVTFTAGIRGVPLPFGADRKLLAWIFDRAIRSESPYIPWGSATEYQQEVGLARSGKNNRDLKARFRRISGLVINIQRRDQEGTADTLYTIIENSYLPNSISDKDESDQRSLSPEFEDRFGIQLNRTLFDDIRLHHLAVPRSLWLQSKGNSQVQDMVLWLYCRCYAAQSESVIPWASLADQFPQDSNSRRTREHAREAIRELRLLWPGCKVEAIAIGIWVDKAAQPLLPDDPAKNRIRRLV